MGQQTRTHFPACRGVNYAVGSTKNNSDRDSAPPLQEGSEFAGMVLGGLIARDPFSLLWRTEPLVKGAVESCVRAIPAANLRSAGAYERLASDLAFWKGLQRAAVDLYEWGRTEGYYYIVMRYMPAGSAADQLGRDQWLRDNLSDFAFGLGAALCELHCNAGAHGNLKPSNVFPLRDGQVLLSDFALPVWLDEYESGCSALEPRLMHPYRAPEQRKNPRDYDMRSDVYTFGLILWQCCTGTQVPANGEGVHVASADWPAGLGPIVERCLAPDRHKRPADGLQLMEMMRKAAEPEEQATPTAEVSTHRRPPKADRAGDLPRTLEEARARMEAGLLEEAVNILESLPPATPGLADLADEIEARHRACEELTREAVRLAGMGQNEAAAETIHEAEQLWPRSPALMTVKAELSGQARADEADAAVKAFRDAFEAGRYDTAEALLEAMLRQGPLTKTGEAAVKQFKRARTRTVFLDSIKAAKRLYVLGHQADARKFWLEAARCLPPGPHRERLRRIADAAAKGKLQVAVEPAEPLPADEGAPPPSVTESGGAGEQPAGAVFHSPAKRGLLQRHSLLVLLVGLAATVAGIMALLWALRRK